MPAVGASTGHPEEATALIDAQELAYGNLSVEDAVGEWFAEAETVLGG